MGKISTQVITWIEINALTETLILNNNNSYIFVLPYIFKQIKTKNKKYKKVLGNSVSAISDDTTGKLPVAN